MSKPKILTEENDFEYIITLKERRAFLATQIPKQTELLRLYDKKIKLLEPERPPIEPNTWQPGSFTEFMGALHSPTERKDILEWRKRYNEKKAAAQKARREKIVSVFEKKHEL